jgi:hypothetical protein
MRVALTKQAVRSHAVLHAGRHRNEVVADSVVTTILNLDVVVKILNKEQAE